MYLAKNCVIRYVQYSIKWWGVEIFGEFCPSPSCESPIKFPSAALYSCWQLGNQLQTATVKFIALYEIITIGSVHSVVHSPCTLCGSFPVYTLWRFPVYTLWSFPVYTLWHSPCTLCGGIIPRVHSVEEGCLQTSTKVSEFTVHSTSVFRSLLSRGVLFTKVLDKV